MAEAAPTSLTVTAASITFHRRRRSTCCNFSPREMAAKLTNGRNVAGLDNQAEVGS